MTCPGCRNGGIVQIGMTLSKRRVTMHSCSRCDTRWWDRDGELVSLGGILELVPRRGPAS